MFKLNVWSNVSDWTWGHKFNSEQELNEFISQQSENEKPFGQNKGRWLPLAEVPESHQSLILETEFRDDEFGNSIEYAHLDKEYTIEIIDLSQDAEYMRAERIKSKIALGKKIKDDLVNAISEYVIGHNTMSGVTDSELDAIMADYEKVFSAIRELRPKKIKQAINSATASGKITQEVKDDLLHILESVGLDD